MTPEEVIRASNDAFNRGDAEAMRAGMRDDIEWVDLQGDVGRVGGRGASDLVAHASRWLEVFEELTAEIVDVTAHGRFAISHVWWRGRTRDGVPAEFFAFDAFEVRDDRVAWVELGHPDEAAARAAIERRRAAQAG